MFDPHRTRRNDRRYYTRKGQVLQAGRVNVQPIIDQRLVPFYQNYLIQNGLVNRNIVNPPETIPVIGMFFNNTKYPFTDFTVTTNQTESIDYQGAGLSSGVLMMFREDVNGNHHASFAYAPADGQVYQVTVTDNRKMYWKLIATSDAGNEEQFRSLPKGLYSKPDDVTPFAQLSDSTMSFSPALKITF